MKRCEISTCQLQILTVGKVASFHTSLQIKLISGVGVHRCVQINEWNSSGAWAPSQYPKRRLFVRSRKVSKPRDWYFKLSYRFEIWQAHRQHCCRSAASSLDEILRKDVFSDIETGPWLLQKRNINLPVRCLVISGRLNIPNPSC